MHRNLRFAAVLGLVMAVPVGAQAQRGAGPRQGGAMGNPVAPIINMRRELNLTGRQLVQLDSIERTLLQRNRAVQERLRAGMDSVRPRGRQMTEEQRTAMRARMDSTRSIRQEIGRNDSTARAAAMRVLTDSQRTRLQVRQAEQRGFAAGRAAAARGQRGMRGGQRGPAVRGRQPMAPRDRMGMRGQGRPRVGPPAGAMGQRGFRGPAGPAPGARPGPMGGGFRRMGPPDGSGPADGQGLAPRRRGMMGGVVAPPEPATPVRPPADRIN